MPRLHDQGLEALGVDAVTVVREFSGQPVHPVAEHRCLRGVAHPRGHRQDQVALDTHLQRIQDQLAPGGDNTLVGRGVESEAGTEVVSRPRAQFGKAGDILVAIPRSSAGKGLSEPRVHRERRLPEAHVQQLLPAGGAGSGGLIGIQRRGEG